MVRLIVYGWALLPAIALLLLQRILHECNLLLLRTAPIDASRLGWFYNLDWHLKLGKKSKVVNLYFNKPSVPDEINKPFLDLWKQHIRILKATPILDLVHRINQKLGAVSYVNPMKDWTLINDDPEYLRLMVHAPLLDFDFDDSSLSRAETEFRGLQIDTPFICFHNRDSSYLKSVSPLKDWSHHDFRDSSVNNLATAVAHLCDTGYSCVRLGTHIQERLAQEGSSKVPLYSATDRQSDLLDMYLAKNCEFFITGDTGINVLPYMFKKPIVFHNWTNIKNVFRYIPFALFIPKMYFSLEEDRFLTFEEMINGVLKDLILTADLDERGILAVENTEEEIKQVVSEMDLRLRGCWRDSEEDLRRQELFWSRFSPPTFRADNFRIGAHFIQKYDNLI